MYNKGKIKKYKVSTATVVLLVILVLVFGLGYIFLCQYMNDNKLRDDAVLLTIKDILIVLLTICGTTCWFLLLLKSNLTIRCSQIFLIKILSVRPSFIST